MQTDRYAVVWTRLGGQPVKVGNLIATGQECRFSYAEAFIDTGIPGLSLIAPPALIGDAPIVHRARLGFPLHPRLMALIPPDNPANLQRRIFARVLEKRGIRPATGFDTDWSLLLLAGRNGIGHLDVFQDDLLAAEWYKKMLSGEAAQKRTARSGLWHSLSDEVRQISHEKGLDALAAMLGPTSSVGGMIEKTLLDIPDRLDWDGRFLVPPGIGAGGDEYVSVLVKMEPPHYEGLLALESLCLEVHRELGFEAPRAWRYEHDGFKLLAIERFDRDESGHPMPFESLLTLFAGGSRSVSSSADVAWPQVGNWIDRLGGVCNLDIAATRETLFKRLAVALMTGNGDMHLDNLGLLGGPENARLAPVYDPAPMRAWSMHNLRMSIPIDFVPDKPVYLQIANTAKAFGLSAARGKDILAWAYESTRQFVDRVWALDEVPTIRRAQLAAVVASERAALSSQLGLVEQRGERTRQTG